VSWRARPSVSLRTFSLIAATWILRVQAMAADGLITNKSGFGPDETMKRLEAEVKSQRPDRVCPCRSRGGCGRSQPAAAAN